MSSTTKAAPIAIDVRFGSATLEIKLDDGHELIAPLAQFPRLRDGPPAARLNWRIVEDGAALHWPDLGLTIAVAELG